MVGQKNPFAFSHPVHQIAPVCVGLRSSFLVFLSCLFPSLPLLWCRCRTGCVLLFFITFDQSWLCFFVLVIVGKRPLGAVSFFSHPVASSPITLLPNLVHFLLFFSCFFFFLPFHSQVIGGGYCTCCCCWSLCYWFFTSLVSWFSHSVHFLPPGSPKFLLPLVSTLACVL